MIISSLIREQQSEIIHGLISRHSLLADCLVIIYLKGYIQ